MEPLVVVSLCFALGVLVLIAEIFIPSHGILGVVGLGFMFYAIYRAYEDIGSTAGHLTVLSTVIVVPLLALAAVKTFHRTPWGRMIAPPNPTVTVSDFAPHYESLKQFVGRTGTTMTPLRPVGTCIFEDQRVNCVAESGMIDSGVEIRVVGIRGHELEVSPVQQA